MKKYIVVLSCLLLALGSCQKKGGQDQVASKSDDIEVWTGNTGFLAVEAGSPVYEMYKELFGVGIVQPYVEWNGGANYEQQLNLRIASGNMPDLFQVVNGMETRLISEGALLELSEYLPEKAPVLWNKVPESIWNRMRVYDPTGNNGLYLTPSFVSYGRTGGLIRKDWLDTLGLDVPTTQKEYVEVLRAFKDKDPNGNGLADEIPTGGRENARWMDHLFAMYGVAIMEGFPQWDVYEGKLTYSGVTKNMKDAILFIHGLYKEGLLDPETMLNSKQDWEGKIRSNRVGSYFHWVQYVHENLEPIKELTGVEGKFVVLPALSAPGYEGFYTHKALNGPFFAVKKQENEKRLEDVMTILNCYGNEEYWDDIYYGVEGMRHKVVDGKKFRLPDDKATQQAMIFEPQNDIGSMDFQIKLLSQSADEDRKWAIEQGEKNLIDLQRYTKLIAGDGIPSSIYTGYPDIQSHTLYFEYVSRIIIGDLPIDAFDEFVERWYASGGKEVTEAARTWYDQVK